MKKLVILLVAIILLSGCMKEDGDGDGLADNIEKEGWDVKVFYPGQINATIYHVSSNPNKRDSDGDGLTDYEELVYSKGALDPNKKDTDKDGLTDYEEARIFETDPLNWHDDIDGDNLPGWKGDYEEIRYYSRHGIDNKTIRAYLQNDDVDGDGAKDGNDKNPLKDLKINVSIKNLIIHSMMDGPNDKILEIKINVSTDADYHIFDLPPVIVGINYTLNLSCTLDLDDHGIPGEIMNSIAISVMDMDKGIEINPLDGFPEMDIVRIYRIATEYTGSYVTNEFNITKDCHDYHIRGPDGELWFEISDASEN